MNRRMVAILLAWLISMLLTWNMPSDRSSAIVSVLLFTIWAAWLFWDMRPRQKTGHKP